MTNKEKVSRGIELAKSVANLSECKKEKIGVVFMFGNKVISDGYNTYKNGIQHKYYLLLRGKQEQDSLYAEEMALERCENMTVTWQKVVAYVCKINSDGTLGDARPNEYCLRLLHWRGIRDIYYSTCGGAIGRAL